MTSGSMREAIKALNTTFSAPTAPYPLPDELRDTIASFLERYDNIDDYDSQRFHDDLHAVYQRHVAGNPEKLGAFLSALRLVRPALTGETRLTTWWDLVLKPTIDGIGHKRRVIDDASEFLQGILVYDAETDHNGEAARLSSLFTKKLLDAYLARTNVFSSWEDAVNPENEFVSHELEAVLMVFGRKMPKALLLALDELFVQKQYRIQALTLLSAFVRLQPPHLHLVLETPLIQNLQKSLLIDTSSTVIELALVVLIMFLPHICGALSSDQSLRLKCFLIYSRVLCWDKLGNPEDSKSSYNNVDDQSNESQDEEEVEPEQAWERVQHSMDYPDSSPPTLMHYFTFLYGLFPLNFMSFVRKPRKYLKSLNFPGARDFDLDQDLIHSRTEPYRRVHLLHPNMFTTTIEDELSDHRWLKSDPVDVVTECMDLCVAVSTTLDDPGPPPMAKLPPIPDVANEFALDEDEPTTNDSKVSWRNTQATMVVPLSEAPDMPELENGLFQNTASTIEDSLKQAKDGLAVRSPSPLPKDHSIMDSPTLPPVKDTKKQYAIGAPGTTQRFVSRKSSLDNFAQSVTGATSPTHPGFQNQNMASLQREIMLLRNDLNFERYLKMQHLAHIGHLQRKHIKEATAEAETQNLINSNKTLKARLAKANELYAQLKKETLTSRNQSKRWENDLSAKVRSYKESEKSWGSDGESLRFQLQKTQADYENLKDIVERAEAERLKAQQRTRALEYDLEHYCDVQQKLEIAQEKIITYESQSKDLNMLIQERTTLRNDLEVTNMRLNSREAERERAIKAYERRIMELETRLQMAERNTGKPGQLPASVQQMLDSALAASNNRLEKLKKANQELHRQYTELSLKHQDLQGERQAELDRFPVPQSSKTFELDQSQISRSSSTKRANNFSPRYVPSLTTDMAPSEEREYFPDYQSPTSVSNSPGISSPARPVRSESSSSQRAHTSQKPQVPQLSPLSHPAFGGGLVPEYPGLRDGTVHSLYGARKPTTPNAVQSSAKSSWSVHTDGSGSREKQDKDKPEPKPEVRVFGRGGAQNMSKKPKDKEPKKPASSKTGGFRGLKGIM
ncbi:hypothetical protein P153DRAFT_316029 [Dothidotthia symphoricarpi CBS 119687]|uniref:Hamartin n=1 Tax=Dothidotthia symphoricarpi CBS 119687 TaxID=1392245 RepID=A0A6A6ABE4_9PLEO|nr:uncharacterized protein P153DRAFT_316029 [Dothidotthia symphoricarpi CBS 119687]KAF2129262.1 hypothetical protein P153DRAFT_316029 [Dothidotthia symphoricarpi CBS 119687]